MLISLVVVGGAIAVVLKLAVGEMGQPATQEPKEAGASRDADDAPVPAHEPAPTAAPAERAPGRVAAPAHPPRVVPGRYSFDPAPRVTVGRRLRSALGLVLVVAAVGLGLAATVGAVVVVISRALEGAVN